ncbi:connectin-like [Diorhabda sublineata]|uniref:connectin-like n=1 Tax=Diorhabda sublineata TaxID=1163346 RepID=UPI0024E0DB23|nr:connectin-like [Diorhabda sublineata]
MWLQILFFVLLHGKVSCDCIKKINRIFCNETTFVSGDIFNGTLDNINYIEIINRSRKPLTITKDSFKNGTDLKTILMKENKIRKLYAYTFRDLRNLESLYLYLNDISDMYPPTFVNLSSLKTIFLNENKLSFIREGTFEDLPNLSQLDLSHNQLTELGDKALNNLPNLTKLKLNNNKIRAIFVHKILSHPKKLKILWLHNNTLTVLSNFALENLSNLKILNLGFNNISTIEEGTFNQTPQLNVLVLTHNKLKEISGNEFPRRGMDFLETLYIDHNYLMYLQSKFFIRLSSLKSVTLMGNPWFCPCLEDIYKTLRDNEIKEKCQQRYMTGERPICVNDNVENKLCTFHYDPVLSRKYINYFIHFPIVIPISECLI